MDPNYGNCFTFNIDPNTHFMYRAGVPHGLQVIFKARSDDYLPFILASGFKILFQNQTEPRIMDLGLTASAGSSYFFDVQQTVIGKIGQPYGTCVDQSTPVRNFFPEGYSMEVKIDYPLSILVKI